MEDLLRRFHVNFGLFGFLLMVTAFRVDATEVRMIREGVCVLAVVVDIFATVPVLELYKNEYMKIIVHHLVEIVVVESKSCKFTSEWMA
jgi:hypothetical protein